MDYNCSRARKKAQDLFFKVVHLQHCCKCVSDCEEKMKHLKCQTNDAEQILDELCEKSIKRIRCVSIILLKVIKKYSPHSCILEKFAWLLDKEDKYCESCPHKKHGHHHDHHDHKKPKHHDHHKRHESEHNHHRAI